MCMHASLMWHVGNWMTGMISNSSYYDWIAIHFDSALSTWSEVPFIHANVWPKGLSHIHGSQHESSRILIRGVPARNTTVTVFLLRCKFLKFFKGAFTHSQIATRTIPGHHSGIICVISGITVYTPGRHPAWSYLWLKNQTCAIFCPGPVHGWKIICTTPGRHHVPPL